MKTILASLLVLIIGATSFAGVPKATAFGSIAENTITTMYGRDGDTVSLQLVRKDDSEAESLEIWRVTLNNKNRNSPVTFEVVISQNTIFGEGESDIATIKVNSVSGN